MTIFFFASTGRSLGQPPGQLASGLHLRGGGTLVRDRSPQGQSFLCLSVEAGVCVRFFRPSIRRLRRLQPPHVPRGEHVVVLYVRVPVSSFSIPRDRTTLAGFCLTGRPVLFPAVRPVATAHPVRVGSSSQRPPPSPSDGCPPAEPGLGVLERAVYKYESGARV